MRVTVRGALTAAVTTAALTASLGSYAAAAPAAAPTAAPAPAAAVGTSAASAVVPSGHCTLRATTANPDGQLYEHIFDPDDYAKAPFREWIYQTPARLTAMSGTYTQANQQYLYYRQFAVRADRLVFGTTHYNTDQQTKAYTEKKFGTGWGAVTKLVDASDRDTMPGLQTKHGYFYAISSRTGNLSRFAVSEPTWGAPAVAAAGARSGFGAVTAMTLAFTYKEDQPESAVDGILMTTSRGRLYLVTMKRSGAFAPHLILLRDSTWHFDGLALDRCGPDSWVLVAADHHADTAVTYELFDYRGTSTTIRRLAKVPTTWDASFTTSFWLVTVPHLDPAKPLPR